MAVAAAWHVDPNVLHFIRKLARRNNLVKIQREAERGLQRHGRGIQLTAKEVRTLLEFELPPKTREVIDELLAKIVAAEEDEARNKERARAATATARELMRVHQYDDLRIAEAAYPRVAKLEGEGHASH